MTAAAEQVSRTVEKDGALWRIRLGPAPANIVDRACCAALCEQLAAAATAEGVKLLVLEGEGEHFSFGASVPEHMPDQVGEMLPEFHETLRAFNAPGLPPVLALVRGMCLGGGLEVALACDVILAEESAKLGCPEVQLAVFAPAGSALLPLRIPAGRASAALLAGSNFKGAEGHACGLVDLLAEDGAAESALEAWYDRAIAPKSAAALRFARQAARWPWRRALDEELPELERLYLEEMMQSEDALEGLNAFVEKRKPSWRDR